MPNSNSNSNQAGQGKGSQGFASMDPQRQREIASEGGRAAHQSGNAHEFTSEEVSEAGKKSRGGQSSGGGGGNQGGSSGQGGGKR